MTETPDLKALAGRYLDLWQDQMNRMANDPATADMMTRTFSLMTKSAQAFAAADAASRDQAPQQGTPSSDATDAPPFDVSRGAPSPSGKTHTGVDEPATSGSSAGGGNGGGCATPQPDGASASAAVFGNGGMDFSWLFERLATLEARVALLESRLSARDDD